MNREQRFQRSINVLLEAYESNKLVPGDCAACAVGNLLADGLDQRIVKGERSYRWDGEFSSSLWYDKLYYDPMLELDYLDRIAYSVEELEKIEDAFESGSGVDESLRRVVTTLMNVHDVQDRKWIKERLEFTIR